MAMSSTVRPILCMWIVKYGSKAAVAKRKIRALFGGDFKHIRWAKGRGAKSGVCWYMAKFFVSENFGPENCLGNFKAREYFLAHFLIF